MVPCGEGEESVVKSDVKELVADVRSALWLADVRGWASCERLIMNREATVHGEGISGSFFETRRVGV